MKTKLKLGKDVRRNLSHLLWDSIKNATRNLHNGYMSKTIHNSVFRSVYRPTYDGTMSMLESINRSIK